MRREELADGGFFVFTPDFVAREEADRLVARLREEVPWTQQTLRIAGRAILEPRLTAWFGEPDARYTYSGMERIPLPWTPLLAALRDRVVLAAEAPLNSVLVNQYRDGTDSVGFHADAERELGRDPVIASLSFGETRRFVLKHKRRTDVAPVCVDLPHGSLLLMGGTTQHFWRHAVPKQPSVCGARINLTFRRILEPALLAQPARTKVRDREHERQ